MKKSPGISLNLIRVLVLVGCCRLAQSRATKFVLVNYEETIRHNATLVGEPTNRSPTATANGPTPVVFWHGMGDTANGSCNIDRKALEKMFPGIVVLSVQIGNNMAEDIMNSYLSNVNHQIDKVCQALLASPTLRQHKTFNAVGFSQGAQFLRGLIQRCPFRENNIKPRNLISLGGQHQGVYGLPNCESFVACDYVRYVLTHVAYVRNIQEHVVQAEYWHDPTREEEYRQKNIFLTDINNENQINETYRSNLLSLDNLVLVQFEQDDMVIPRESSLFGYYEAGNTSKIVAMEKSQLYLEDRLGLRQLDLSGRLHQVKIPGRHLQYPMSWFLNNIASIYLNN